jgi:hypothetical protein
VLAYLHYLPFTPYKSIYKFWDLELPKELNKFFKFQHDSNLFLEIENHLNSNVVFKPIQHQEFFSKKSKFISSFISNMFKDDDIPTVLTEEDVVDFSNDKSNFSNKSCSQKDEIIHSLHYLKSKKIKSKQDLDSIYTLEMILKNLK